MIKPGLCSVTFREKSPEEIIELCVAANMSGIEWGADVHVPPGDFVTARHVAKLTRAAGLDVIAYGSYFFAFDKIGDTPHSFEPVLATAVMLETSVIRIWAGSLTIQKTDAYFEDVVKSCRKMADKAAVEGIVLAFEYHRNTFTETLEGSLKLLKAIDRPNVKMYWQPQHGSDLNSRIHEITSLADNIVCAHIFHWGFAVKPPFPRFQLADGASLWVPSLEALARLASVSYALIEFVCDDKVEAFQEDAATLLKWIQSVSTHI